MTSNVVQTENKRNGCLKVLVRLVSHFDSRGFKIQGFCFLVTLHFDVISIFKNLTLDSYFLWCDVMWFFFFFFYQHWYGSLPTLNCKSLVPYHFFLKSQSPIIWKKRTIFGTSWSGKITVVSSIKGLKYYCFTGGRGSWTMLRWIVGMLCEYVAGCQQETPPSNLRQ